MDKRQYPNQCAVNIYEALKKSGVNVNSFYGQLSWQKDKPKYAIRAQELADWLASPANPVQASAVKYSGEEVFDKIKGRTGIIFFQNYWGLGNQGDHIDLWNGTRLTHWTSWLRIQLHISGGGWSNYRQAETVWFWQIQ
ncbi:MAG: T6SS effector amidase Tae4 family protein [Candidatus Methylumidiphilus sp.]